MIGACNIANNEILHKKQTIEGSDNNLKTFLCDKTTIIIDKKVDNFSGYSKSVKLLECYAQKSYTGDNSIKTDLFDFLNSHHREVVVGYLKKKAYNFRGRDLFTELLEYSNNHNCDDELFEPNDASSNSLYLACLQTLYGMIRSIKGLSVNDYMSSKSGILVAELSSRDSGDQCFDVVSEGLHKLLNDAWLNDEVQLKSYNEE